MIDDKSRGDFEKTLSGAHGIGQNADGTFSSFPASELAAKVEARDREETEESDEDLTLRAKADNDEQIEQIDAELAELEADDVGDLSDLDDAVEALKS